VKAINKNTSLLKLAQNVIWNLAGQILPLIIAVVVVPILIKHMGLDRYGFLTLAWVLIGYAGLFDFGISRAMTRLVANHLAIGDEVGATRIANAGASFMIIFGCTVGILLIIFSKLIVGRWLNVPLDIQSEALNSLRILAISVPVVLLTAAYRGILEAHLAFKQVAIIRVVMGLATYLGPLVVLVFSIRLEAVVGIVVLMRIVANFAHAQICRSYTHFHYQWAIPDKATTHQLFSLGGWISVSNVVSPIMTYMDRFILGGMVSIQSVVYYATPYDMITRVMVFPYSLMGVLFPVVSGMAKDPVRARSTYTTTIRALYVLMFPVAFVAIVLAEPLLQLWLGADFSSHAAPVLKLLAIGVLANTLAQAPANMIQSIGNPKWMSLTHVIELPLFLLAIWYFTHKFGIIGTAFSWAGRMIVDMSILYVLASWKLVKPKFQNSGFLITLLISLTLLFVGFLPITNQQCLIVSITGLIFFWGFCWFGVFTNEDKMNLSNLLKSFSRDRLKTK
jgi:O-antigen/teichoic acid export membrane protein